MRGFEWAGEHYKPLLLTAVYLAVFGFWNLTRGEGETLLQFFRYANLNEVGDLLAGLFSPVAFLWLVYGYLLQSKELGLQRETLDGQMQQLALQRVELARSSTALVDQVDLLREQLEMMKASQQPIISIKHQAGDEFKLTNSGGRALYVSLKRSDSSKRIFDAPILGTGESAPAFRITGVKRAVINLECSYSDSYFANHTRTWRVASGPEGNVNITEAD